MTRLPSLFRNSVLIWTRRRINRILPFVYPAVPLLLALLLSGCSFSLAADITPPPGANIQQTSPTNLPLSGPLYPLLPPNPGEGAVLYAAQCAACHGNSGLGDGPQASQLAFPATQLGSAQVARQAKPVQWYSVVTQGNLEHFMPPFSNLSDRQRWDLIAYSYSLSAPPDMVSQGQELFQANCARCHGESGQGNGPEAPGLSRAPANFNNQAWMAGKSAADLFQTISAGATPDMPAYSQISEDERWAVTAYLRSLTFAPEKATASVIATPLTAVTTEVIATPDTGTPTSWLRQRVVTGTVTGKVTNAAGVVFPAGLTVTLHGYDDMQPAVSLTTTLTAENTFTFSNVEMPEGRAFIASLEYIQETNGISYTATSDVATVLTGQTSLELVIPIYATTTDPAVLSVDRLHLFLNYVEPSTMQVVELFIISNLSDSTLVAAEKGQAVFSIALPKEATNLQFEDGTLGDRYIKTVTNNFQGFGDTQAVQPGAGTHQVVFAFDMPYTNKMNLVQPLNLPVNAVVVLVPADGFKITADQLQAGEPRTVQGITYSSYSGGRTEAGQSISITISGRPGGGAAVVGGSQIELIVGLGVFGLTLITISIWLYRRSQSAHPVEAVNGRGAGKRWSMLRLHQQPELVETTPDDSSTLMDAIIALDEQFQSGGLPEEAYRERRMELKGRLKEALGAGELRS